MSELLGANSEVLDRHATSLNTDARRVQDIRMMTGRAMTELQGSWNGSDLIRLTQQWEQQASALLAEASASLDTCAARLRAQSAAQRLASSRDGGSPTTPLPMALLRLTPPACPPKGGSSAGAALWWRSLSPQQQQQVISTHPDWIGNRDGVPFTARDLANRALLSVDRRHLVAEMEHLQTQRKDIEVAMAESLCAGILTHDPGALNGAALNDIALNDAALNRVRAKTASIEAIVKTLAGPEQRQLLLLDLDHERAQAAIARGDVDTADHVAVLVPGLSTTVSDGMVLGDRNLGDLRRQTELELRRAHTSQSVATVMWIGYQAPQLGWDLVGENSVADDFAARKGAAQLVPFLQGIGAAREKDPHLTLLAHSYGTTTAGLALRQSTRVDDAVFFGSPGLDTSHLSDLVLPQGHAYYIEAEMDVVGDLGRFGVDPSHLAGIEHASAADSTVVDPLTGEIRRFQGVTGHSSYLVNHSTSQYNMAVVAAGLADRRVRDAGEGIGDLLSWPIPGTS